MTTDRWLRVSDQDRQSAVELFSEAYAVGRLSHEELDERVTAAYSAKTHGDLRDLAGDLPRPAAPAGLRSETVASRRAPQGASRRLVSVMIWMLFALVLAAGLAGLASPAAVWVTAIPVPIALLLTPALGIGWRHSTHAGTQSSCASGWVTRLRRDEGGEGA